MLFIKALFFAAILACTLFSVSISATRPAPAVGSNTPVTDTVLRRYLALGDSYTIGQSVAVKDRFPVQTVSLLRTAGYNIADADIIATSGWTTADLNKAVSEKSFTCTYDVVSLLIGVNNQYKGGHINAYRKEFTSLLEKSIRLAGNRPGRVFVLSIPDYSVTPFASAANRKKIAREINRFNLINSEVAQAHHVHYVNITAESRKAAKDPTLIAYDGLHFSGKEYYIWSSVLTRRMISCM